MLDLADCSPNELAAAHAAAVQAKRTDTSRTIMLKTNQSGSTTILANGISASAERGLPVVEYLVTERKLHVSAVDSVAAFAGALQTDGWMFDAILILNAADALVLQQVLDIGLAPLDLWARRLNQRLASQQISYEASTAGDRTSA